MSDPRKPHEILKAIHESLGMAHINRSHQRSFSLNIFLMNAQELIGITQQVHDPDEGLRLMSQDNREAGQQTHREINRRIHNFVASALTLVEHTRIFMRDQYDGTQVLADYEKQVRDEFADDPVSQFVQKLRNYMMHKGLPNSEMFLEMHQDPDSGQGASLQTGVRLNTESLLEWEGWGAIAETYIKSSGEHIDVKQLTDEYTAKVAAFHERLQKTLDRHHGDDLSEFRELQDALRKAEAERPQQVTQSTVSEASAPLSDTGEKIEELARALLAKISKLEFAKGSDSPFKTQRPIETTLTDADMRGPPLMWGPDVNGDLAFAFIYKDDGTFGLQEKDHAAIRPLVEKALTLPWAAETLSRTFIEETAIEWLQKSFGEPSPESFVTYLKEKADKAVKPLALWAPIANLEVEASFALGPVEVRPITAAMIDDMHKNLLGGREDSEGHITVFIERFRKRMQGLAAIVIEKTGDAKRLQEEGGETAKAAVGLLRFLSPAAANPLLSCGMALLGSELVPAHNLFVLGDGTFNYSEGMQLPSSPGMRISAAYAERQEGTFETLGRLVRPEGLNQFAFTVRASILLFTTGLTLPDPLDRLAYSVSAMEKLLLRHTAEAREFNVAQRIALVLSIGGGDVNDAMLTTREAYRLLARRDLRPLAPHLQDAALTFSLNAYNVLRIALENIEKFETVQQFIAVIDNMQRSRTTVQRHS